MTVLCLCQDLAHSSLTWQLVVVNDVARALVDRLTVKIAGEIV